MCILGLTGGIASGKSTVARHLGKLGAFVIDADAIAREAVAPGSPLLGVIKEKFGPDSLLPDGNLDRKFIAGEVFSDPAKRKALNGIMHPYIVEKIREKAAEEQRRDSERIIVIDIPLLMETGLHEFVDRIWTISVTEKTQIARAVQRDGLSGEEVRKRIRAQMSDRERNSYADSVIDGNGSETEVLQQAEKLFACLQKELKG